MAGPPQPLIQLFRASLQPPALAFATQQMGIPGKTRVRTSRAAIAVDVVPPGTLWCRRVATATGFPPLTDAHPEQNWWQMQN